MPPPADRSTSAAPLPTWGWALRRAGLGLAIMLAVTSLAAYLAHASIDTPAEAEGSPGITIGAPAAALLKR